MDVKRRDVGWLGGFDRGVLPEFRGRAEFCCCGEESFSMPSSSEQRTEQEQELWRELQANVAAVAACYPSAEVR